MGRGSSAGGGNGSAKNSAGGEPSLSAKIPNGFGVNNKAEALIRSSIVNFQKEHADSKTEFGLIMDNKGNIVSTINGEKKHVDMVAGKDKLSIHNHPSGSTMFSASDLLLVGVDGNNGAKGAVVTTKTGIAIIQTGKNFKALEFASRFYNTNFKTKWNFASDEQCNDWLIKNQSKYNYKYTRIKI